MIDTKSNLELPEVGKWGKFRRWLGFYSRDEKEIRDYAKKIKQYMKGIADGSVILTSRPKWMREEDCRAIRKFQTKIERKNRKGRRIS